MIRIALLALGTAAGCTGSPTPGETAATTAPTTTTPTTTVPTAVSPTSASPSTAERAWVPVYYVLDTRAGLRLARERRELPGGGVAAAVETMIAGPHDTDYSTTWNPGTRVLGVQEEPGLLTVDLSAEARTADVGSPGAALMIQQLVWTATDAAADPAAGVQLLIDGDPAGELWGAVTWDEPIVRADDLDVRLLVQLDSPAPGEVFTSRTVGISGEAAVFEANLPWKLYDAEGAELVSGFTMTAAGQEFAPFAFDLEVEPGEYVIEIVEDDPSDGAAGTPMSDTRTFVVE